MTIETRILDEPYLITICPNCKNRAVEEGDFRRNRDITLDDNPFCSEICRREFIGLPPE